MRPLRSRFPAAARVAARAGALAAVLAAPLALAGCGVHFVGDAGENGEGAEAIPIVTNPPSYPANAVIFTVDVATQLAGEQVDLRFDGVRIYRKSLTTAPGAALTERLRFPLAPGLRNFFVRIGTDTYGVTTETAVDTGAQPCATIRFVANPDVPQLSRVTIELPPPSTCPR